MAPRDTLTQLWQTLRENASRWISSLFGASPDAPPPGQRGVFNFKPWPGTVEHYRAEIAYWGSLPLSDGWSFSSIAGNISALILEARGQGISDEALLSSIPPKYRDVMPRYIQKTQSDLDRLTAGKQEAAVPHHGLAEAAPKHPMSDHSR